MVPAAGFEPATFGLQNRCTTTVLSRLTVNYRLKLVFLFWKIYISFSQKVPASYIFFSV